MSKQIEIEVNGKELVCKFGLRFLGKYLEEIDMNLQDMMEATDKNPYKWMPFLIYRSAEMGNKGGLDFTVEELEDWLDCKEGILTIKKVETAFVQSLVEDVPKQDANPSTRKSTKKK